MNQNKCVYSSHQSHFLPKTINDLLLSLNSNQLTLPHETEISMIIMTLKLNNISELAGIAGDKEEMNAECFGLTSNSFLSRLSAIIAQAEGVVLKYLIDSLTAIWDCQSEKNKKAQSAVKCAQLIISNMKSQWSQADVKIGIAYGRGTITLVEGKGYNDFLISGEALDKAEKRMNFARGQIITCKRVYDLIGDFCKFTQFKEDYYAVKAEDSSWISQSKCSYGEYEGNCPLIQSFIPSYLSEACNCDPTMIDSIHWCTSVYILISFKSFPLIDELQQIVSIIHECLSFTKGIMIYINQFAIYSIEALCVYGVKSNSHCDAASCAVSFAILISKSLALNNIRSSIGVSTGNSFCSLRTGLYHYTHYAVSSQRVLLSKALAEMGKKSKSNHSLSNQIYCDDNTYHKTQYHYRTTYVDNISFNLFKHSIAIYTPMGNEDLVLPSEFNPFPFIITHLHNSYLPHSQSDSISYMKSLEMCGLIKEKKRMAALMKSVCQQRTKQFFMVKGYKGVGKSLFIRNVLTHFIDTNHHLASLYLFRSQHFKPIKPLPPFIITTRQTPYLLNYPLNGFALIFRKIYRFMLSSEHSEKAKKKIAQLLADSNCIDNRSIEIIELVLSLYHNDDIDIHFLVNRPKINRLSYSYPPIVIDNIESINLFFMELLSYYRCFINAFYDESIPLIFIIEDTHLIDAYSFQFLIELLESSSDELSPLIVIMCYQIALHPFLMEKTSKFLAKDSKLLGTDHLLSTEVNDKAVIFLEVKPITDLRSMERILLNNMTNKRDIVTSGALLEYIIAKSNGGIPLFAIELMESLMKEAKAIELISVISLMNGNNLLIDFNYPIPNHQKRINNCLIDKLDANQWYLLKLCSLIGPMFDNSLVEAASLMTHLTQEDIRRILFQLSDSSFIEVLYDEGNCFVGKFSIVFLRECIEQMIPESEKLFYMIRIANAMHYRRGVRYLPLYEYSQIERRLLMKSKAVVHSVIPIHFHFKEMISGGLISISEEGVLLPNGMMVNLIDKMLRINANDVNRYAPIMKGNASKHKLTQSIGKLRYCVLTTDVFAYYHSMKEINEKKAPLALIQLKYISKVELIALDKLYLAITAFKYYKKSESKSEKTLIFSFDSNEMYQWAFFFRLFSPSYCIDNDNVIYHSGPSHHPLKTESFEMSDEAMKKFTSTTKALIASTFFTVVGLIQNRLIMDKEGLITNQAIPSEGKNLAIPLHLVKAMKRFFESKRLSPQYPLEEDFIDNNSLDAYSSEGDEEGITSDKDTHSQSNAYFFTFNKNKPSQKKAHLKPELNGKKQKGKKTNQISSEKKVSRLALPNETSTNKERDENLVYSDIDLDLNANKLHQKTHLSSFLSDLMNHFNQ